MLVDPQLRIFRWRDFYNDKDSRNGEISWPEIFIVLYRQGECHVGPGLSEAA
jgi:hypothetical protein